MGRLLGLGVLCCMLALSRALTEDHAQIFRDNNIQVIEAGDSYFILSNGIPDHDHGPFPSPGNPNEVSEQEHNYTVPKVPTIVNPPGCLPMGTIGIATNGVVLFSPYTAELYNAVEGEHKEVFDDCDGHPQMQGVYHYHKIPGCLFNSSSQERDVLIGVALDGYPIYGPIDEAGRQLTSADLDFCHGRTSASGEYRYHMTYDFPYILGCFMGQVNYEALKPDGPPNGGPQDGGQNPPRDDGRTPPPNGDPQDRGQNPPRDDGRTPPPGQNPPRDGQQMPGPGPMNNFEDLCRYANESNPGLPGGGDRGESTEPPSAGKMLKYNELSVFALLLFVVMWITS